MTDEFDNFVDSWKEETLHSLSWAPSWTVANASNQSLLNKIDSSWLKKRMLREGFATDDDSADDNAFTIDRKIGGEKYCYLRWLRRFDRFINDWNANPSGSKPSLNCSKEEITVTFYFFIYFKKTTQSFKKLFNLLCINRTANSFTNKQKTSNILLQLSWSYFKDNSVCIEDPSDKIRGVINRRIEEAAYVADSNCAIPLSSMFMTSKKTQPSLLEFNSSTKEVSMYTTGFKIETCSILREALHPHFCQSRKNIDGVDYVYVCSPHGFFCWLQLDNVLSLNGLAKLPKISYSNYRDSYVEPASRIVSVPIGGSHTWNPNIPNAILGTYELTPPNAHQHNGVTFDNQAGTFSLDNATLSDVGFCRKTKPSSTIKPEKETKPPYYEISAQVNSDVGTINCSIAYIREFDDSANPKRMKKTGQYFSKNDRVKFIPFIFTQDTGPYTVSQSPIASRTVCNYGHNKTSSGNKDWQYVKLVNGNKEGWILEDDISSEKITKQRFVGVFEHDELLNKTYWTNCTMSATKTKADVCSSHRTTWMEGNSWLLGFGKNKQVQLLTRKQSTNFHAVIFDTVHGEYVLVRSSNDYSYTGFIPKDSVNIPSTIGSSNCNEDKVISGIVNPTDWDQNSGLESLYPNGINFSFAASYSYDKEPNERKTFHSEAVQAAQQGLVLGIANQMIVLGLSTAVASWVEIPRNLDRLSELGLRTSKISMFSHGYKTGFNPGVWPNYKCRYSALNNFGMSNIDSMIGDTDTSEMYNSFVRNCTQDLRISLYACNTAYYASEKKGFAYSLFHNLNKELADISIIGHRTANTATRNITKRELHANHPNNLKILKDAFKQSLNSYSSSTMSGANSTINLEYFFEHFCNYSRNKNICGTRISLSDAFPALANGYFPGTVNSKLFYPQHQFSRTFSLDPELTIAFTQSYVSSSVGAANLALKNSSGVTTEGCTIRNLVTESSVQSSSSSIPEKVVFHIPSEVPVIVSGTFSIKSGASGDIVAGKILKLDVDSSEWEVISTVTVNSGDVVVQGLLKSLTKHGKEYASGQSWSTVGTDVLISSFVSTSQINVSPIRVFSGTKYVYAEYSDTLFGWIRYIDVLLFPTGIWRDE